jgi:lipoic acid synthetase/lipoyl(octanoyl) transferase
LIDDDPGALETIWLGRMGFAEALALQLSAREALVAGVGPPMLLLVEHPPTLTLGRRGRREDVLWTDEQLAAFGVAVCETPRGGQTTLHAPGQLVAYPIVRIGLRVRAHVTDLGAAALALLSELGLVGAELRLDPLGVWIGPRKLASIGVHVSRGVTVQGLAVNLDVDPRLFGALVSCGMPSVTMTNAIAEGARPIAIDEAARRFAAHWGARTGRALRWRSPSSAP